MTEAMKLAEHAPNMLILGMCSGVYLRYKLSFDTSSSDHARLTV